MSTQKEISSELGKIKDKLAEKEPVRDKTDIELMKMKCEIKELKNRQAELKKQLKNVQTQDSHSQPPPAKKKKSNKQH